MRGQEHKHNLFGHQFCNIIDTILFIQIFLKQAGTKLDQAQIIVMEKLKSKLKFGTKLMLEVLEQLVFQYLDGWCSSNAYFVSQNAERQCQPTKPC